HEVHGQRRLGDAQHRQRFGLGGVGQRTSYADLVDPIDQHNVAGLRLVDQNAFQAAEFQDLIDARLDGLAFRTKLDDDVLQCPNPTAVDTPHPDLADVGVVVQ